MEEKDEKGFTVKDRRKVSLDDLNRDKAESPEEKQAEGPRAEAEAKAGFEQASEQCRKAGSAPLPEVSFSTFMLSLSSSALVHLGEIPDPMSQATETDLLMAKQIIDTLGMLQEKTRGNLDAEEERLVKTLLYDLRLRYVQKCGK
jgi:hypothetical protein